jgi:(p)ppGpp synthase/HD superfamily hydrolase
MDLIIRAAQYAAQKHAGQKRKYNNRPYITHPIRVAGRVATHEMATKELVAASFLHDVSEDCGVAIDEIARHFGQPVSWFVDELTNKKIHGGNRESRKRADRERIKSISTEAKLVKLIDRIDNLYEMPESDGFALVYAKESILLLDECLTGIDVELEQELRNRALDIFELYS